MNAIGGDCDSAHQRSRPMQILACAAPTDALEAAPLTDLSLHIGDDGVRLTAFWSGDNGYFVRAESLDGAQEWFQITAEPSAPSLLSTQELERLGAMMASVLPLGAGRVAFPVGSTGRTVFRIWRTRGAGASAKTRIRGVRAARSRRLPA
jgi:hypothetical protein